VPNDGPLPHTGAEPLAWLLIALTAMMLGLAMRPTARRTL
jgi:hypothetical protein